MWTSLPKLLVASLGLTILADVGQAASLRRVQQTTGSGNTDGDNNNSDNTNVAGQNYDCSRFTEGNSGAGFINVLNNNNIELLSQCCGSVQSQGTITCCTNGQAFKNDDCEANDSDASTGPQVAEGLVPINLGAALPVKNSAIAGLVGGTLDIPIRCSFKNQDIPITLQCL